MQGRRSAGLLGVVIGVLLLAATPAAADTIVVTTTADGGGTCPATATTPCALRTALTVAAGTPTTTDRIELPPGAIQLASQLQITSPVDLAGKGADTTFLQGDGKSFGAVSVTSPGSLSNLTIRNGAALNSSAGNGGNLLVSGAAVTLDHVRLTAGAALQGGGLAISTGNVTIRNSLIDNNTARIDTQTSSGGNGGGIVSLGSARAGASATLTVTDSTIASNHAALGAGVAAGGASNSNVFSRVTIADNAATSQPGGGVYVADAEPFTVQGSILARNTGNLTPNGAAVVIGPSNCSASFKPSSLGGNVVSTVDCAFTRPTDAQNADPQLASPLADAGGQTPVLAIPATSPAFDRAGACTGTDQRDLARPQGAACDAGAYEVPVAVPTPTATPAPQSTVSPTATPAPTPTPTATPTPTPIASPVFHKTVVIGPVSGKIRVKLPGSSVFVDLDATRGIPLGSTVDAKHGVLLLTSVPKPGGKPESAKFWAGIFRVTQPAAVTDLQLNEALAACPKSGRASAAAAKPKSRKLWGDGSGSFRTRGRYSSATVRGTKWLVTDTCAGTTTRVVRGVVEVRDSVRHKSILLRTGKHYLAKPKA